jgi:hypothetical protein
MFTIERVFSQERPTQLPYIEPELRLTDLTPSGAKFLQLCEQEEQFASNFVEQATQALKIVSNYSEVTEGTKIYTGKLCPCNTKSCVRPAMSIERVPLVCRFRHNPILS